MTYGAEVTVRLPMLQIRDYADRPEVLRAIVDERFRVARLHMQDMVLRNTGVDIGDGKAPPAATTRCTGRCYCHAGPDGLMHPPCCADCAGHEVGGRP